MFTFVTRSVVVECATNPVTADEAGADVTEAVIHAAIKPDMGTPIACMPGVDTTTPAPVTRGPQNSNLRRPYPYAGNPVIALRTPSPVARRPEIAVLWARGLNINRQPGGAIVIEIAMDAKELAGIAQERQIKAEILVRFLNCLSIEHLPTPSLTDLWREGLLGLGNSDLCGELVNCRPAARSSSA